jgi:ankyrin repeat protein
MSLPKRSSDGDSVMYRAVGFVWFWLMSMRALPRKCQPPALVHAAGRGQREIVDILLRANARVNEADERGWTACHAAAQGGHHEVLALLLAHQPNLAAFDVDSKSAFCNAVSICSRDGGRCAVMLLEAGASLERADLCHLAATSTAAIQALINRGVVVREIVRGGVYTPLHAAACRSRARDVLDMLVNVCGFDLEVRINGRTCVHLAAEIGNVFALRWLLNAGADPDGVDSDGSTPLLYVSRHDCAVVLLAAGADVCARDNKGRTVLHGVPTGGMYARLPPMELSHVHPLIAAGADLDAADDFGNTGWQLLARIDWTIDPDQVEVARRDIAKTRIDLVRYRALQGLYRPCNCCELDALQMCEILQFACGRVAPLIPFHIWWKIATTVKHFQSK